VAGGRIRDAVADVYDVWFDPGRRAPDAAVEFLSGLAGDGPVLELGIGTGRIALPLSARGLAVTGIDASTAMLDKLRAKPGSTTIDLVIGDFADVAVPAESFTLVFVAFNTFFALSSQAAQVRCFSGVAAALRPGGIFVIEAFVPDPTRFDRGQRVQVDAINAIGTQLSASVHDPLTQTIRTRQLLFGPEGPRTFPADLRYAWPSELDLMARLAGLELIQRWSDWHRQPFTSASGNHISAWQRPA